MRKLGVAKQKLKQGFLRVQPVFGFVPNDRAAVIQHVFTDFFSAMSG